MIGARVADAALAAVALLAGSCGWLCFADRGVGARRLAQLRGTRGLRGVRGVGGRSWLAGRLRRSQRPPQATAADVPPALDLLAACLSAGAMLAPALSAVALAFDGPIGMLLADIGRLSSLGAAPEDAWSAALRDQTWAPVARAVIRAHHSGAALTDVLSRTATDLRRELRTQAESAAARASVKAVLPLGLCFLPAFLLIGVVPVVAGFARPLW